MALTSDEVRQIASLARVAIDDGQVERLRAQLSAILDHFGLLAELDTSNVAPTTQALPLVNVMRDDTTWDSWSPHEILAAAPRIDSGYIRVRAVFE